MEGPVSISNWARTRKQKILRDLSFESNDFDIYQPYFSSEEEYGSVGGGGSFDIDSVLGFWIPFKVANGV